MGLLGRPTANGRRYRLRLIDPDPDHHV